MSEAPRKAPPPVPPPRQPSSDASPQPAADGRPAPPPRPAAGLSHSAVCIQCILCRFVYHVLNPVLPGLPAVHQQSASAGGSAAEVPADVEVDDTGSVPSFISYQIVLVQLLLTLVFRPMAASVTCSQLQSCQGLSF